MNIVSMNSCHRNCYILLAVVVFILHFLQSSASSISLGERCGHYTQPHHECIKETICVGTKLFKKCKKPKLQGQKCGDPFWVCRKDLKCQRRRCRISVGQLCVFGGHKSQNCELGSSCIGSTCQKQLFPGERCSRNNDRCGSPLLCANDNICRIREGQNCLFDRASRKFCVSGTVCVGNSDRKICKKPMLQGKRCGQDPFWVCQQHLTCQKNICKIPEGENCIFRGQSSQFCVSGTSCIGSISQRTCRKPLTVGASCDESISNKCGVGLKCEERRCKLTENQSCNLRGSLCVSSTSCIGPHGRKICRKPMNAGERCNTDPYWVCKEELSCEKNICRIPSGQSCLGNEKLCIAKAKCLGTRTEKLCGIPMGLHEPCANDPFWACDDKLACVGHVCIPALRIGEPCGAHVSGDDDCDESSNLLCAGAHGRSKRCVGAVDEYGKCGSDKFFNQCSKDLECINGLCRYNDVW